MDGPGMTGQAQREKRASETVRQTRDMVAMINPLLGAAEFVFCATNDAGLAAKAQASSLGWFNEGEGTSLILERSVAEALDSASPHKPRSVDSPKSAFVSLAAVANRAKPLQRTMPSWRIEVQSGGGGRLAHGPLANVKAPVGPTGAAQQLFRIRSVFPKSMCLPKLNSVEPPRYGSVCQVVWEGRCREASPYPDPHSLCQRLQSADWRRARRRLAGVSAGAGVVGDAVGRLHPEIVGLASSMCCLAILANRLRAERRSEAQRSPARDRSPHTIRRY